MFTTIDPILARINAAGFFPIIDGEMPEMMCSFNAVQTYASSDWETLAFYAENYQLCDCGGHWTF
jgi:hypothetical protein